MRSRDSRGKLTDWAVLPLSFVLFVIFCKACPSFKRRGVTAIMLRTQLDPRRAVSVMVVFAVLSAVLVVRADDTPTNPSDVAAEKAALAVFNGLIGDWRGAGQLRRGSNQGAWTETAEWVWDFSDGVAIKYDVAEGHYAKSARLSYDSESKKYRLTLTLPDDTTRTYNGTIDKDKLIVESAAGTGEVHRLTLTQLNEKRTLVLFEKRREAQKTWQRVAEVGYTREGTRLADDGTTGPECVVTGGLGTIAVGYKGQTYYVCCSGCKQAFDADPEGILAEYAARKQEEKQR
jgi:hypothetical protein